MSEKITKRYTRPATFRLGEDVLDRLDAYSRRTGVTKCFAVEAAVRLYLDAAEEKGDGAIINNNRGGVDGE